MMVDLAFALRDQMRRAGPTRHQSADGGGTLELKHSAISHRGFAFIVRGRTYIYEEVRSLVIKWKAESVAFRDLLEMQRDITWVDAIRAQDALRAIWQVMKPIDEPALEPRPLRLAPLSLPPARSARRKRGDGWTSIAVVEREGRTPYDFVLAVEDEMSRLRRTRKDARALRRRWQKTRCVIEVQT